MKKKGVIAIPGSNPLKIESYVRGGSCDVKMCFHLYRVSAEKWLNPALNSFQYFIFVKTNQNQFQPVQVILIY